MKKLPKGYISIFEFNIISYFSGISFKKPSQEDLKAIHRANMILHYGYKQLEEKEGIEHSTELFKNNKENRKFFNN